jgi:hypothetical protein
MRVLRAPLLHFLAGGAILFYVARQSPPLAPVVLSAGDVTRLRVDYTRDTGLEATAADEVALIDKAIYEELLFREAVARGLNKNDRSIHNWLVEQMRVLSDDADADTDRLYARAVELGLDRTDLVVRRILVQKIRLLAARTHERPPSDAELTAFYDTHRDEYRPPDRVTFWHVFLASSAHGAAAADDAEALLARVRREALPPDALAREGDSFPVPPRVRGQSPAQLERLFGGAFAAAITQAETTAWVGPVPSPYGVHLVWIEAREPGEPPPLAAVRERVLERWQDEHRTRRVAELLDALARRYPLRIESDAWRERRAS